MAEMLLGLYSSGDDVVLAEVALCFAGVLIGWFLRGGVRSG